jgi:chaperonin GroES
MKQFTPIHDRVIVRRVEQRKDSPIIIPDAHKEKSTLVEIVAVGPGRQREGYFEPTVVKPGQIAIIGEYVDSEIMGGLTVIAENDIRCIVNA